MSRRNSKATKNEKEMDESSENEQQRECEENDCDRDNTDDLTIVLNIITGKSRSITVKHKKKILREKYMNFSDKNKELKGLVKALQEVINGKLEEVEKAMKERTIKETTEITETTVNTPKSYANITKNKKEEEQYKIVILPKEKQTPEQTRNDIKTYVDPIKNQVGINGLKKTKEGGIGIITQAKKDIKIIKSNLEKN